MSFDRIAIRKLDDGMVKFFAADKINRRTILQRPFGKHGDVRAYERNLDLGIDFLDLARELDVSREARSAGIKHQEFVFLRNFDGLFRRDVVSRGVQQSRTLKHSGRVG